MQFNIFRKKKKKKSQEMYNGVFHDVSVDTLT